MLLSLQFNGKATQVMTEELKKINFKQSKNILISNVTADEISNTEFKEFTYKTD